MISIRNESIRGVEFEGKRVRLQRRLNRTNYIHLFEYAATSFLTSKDMLTSGAVTQSSDRAVLFSWMKGKKTGGMTLPVLDGAGGRPVATYV